jgi:hypothetical protein
MKDGMNGERVARFAPGEKRKKKRARFARVPGSKFQVSSLTSAF